MDPMTEVAIRVENLSKRYHIGRAQQHHDTLRDAFMAGLRVPIERLHRNGRDPDGRSADTIWALRDVSIEVKRGEVIGIIGRNGAGKSTLLKILSQITEPTAGRAIINGRVGSLLEVGTGFHPELTGRENIYLNGAILGMKKTEIERKFNEIVDFSGIEKFLDTPVKRYSSGMTVRLAFAVAAHLEPEILLVDEVLAVGDAAFQRKCLGKMSSVAKEGRTVLLVSHQMSAIVRLCERAILMSQGKVQMDGPADDIVQSYLTNAESQEANTLFPVMNSTHRLGFEYCDVNMIPNADNTTLDLKARIGVVSDYVQRNIGIGFGLTTTTGEKVTTLGPLLTNFTFDISKGVNHFVIESRNIDRHLASGKYIMQLWLAISGISKLVEVDRAALITIPKTNLFGTGRYAKVDQNGPVLLPLLIRPDESN